MTELLSAFDRWLDDAGPAALVVREHLMPVEGPDGVIFPATFAASEDGTFGGGYNIDEFSDGTNVCLIDSVGSQANRIEPIFTKEPYSELLPQIIVKAGDHQINLLNAGHRAGDAIMRCSGLQKELREAFLDALKGNVRALAKIAPTSLVFGVWDSRDTQAKLPRLIASTVRAYNVRKLTRSASYAPPIDHVDAGNIPPYATDKERKELSKRGWLQALASATPGGVVATNGIRREASFHLAALRLLAAGGDTSETVKLQRYVLGLALVAFTRSPSSYLRQGCNLVQDPGKPRVFELVLGDGTRERATLTHDESLAFASVAAKAFGKGADRKIEFDKDLAKKDIGSAASDGEKGGPKAKAKKGR